jgi:hypothetical protein
MNQEVVDCRRKSSYLLPVPENPLKSVSPPARKTVSHGGVQMSLGLILIIILILLLLGAIPSWPHSRNWGYGPSGGIGLLLVIIIILLLLKVI